MAGKGENFITSNYFETRLAKTEAMINSILAGIAIDATNGSMKNFMIQSGTASVTVGADVTITFPVAYSVAPRVFPSVAEDTINDANVVFHTVTTTTFKMRVFNRTNGGNCDCHWFAFGKRG